MNTKRTGLLTIVLFCILAGCGTLNSVSNANDDHTNSNISNDQSEHFFIGTIDEIYGETALVHIEEGGILNSGNQVTINISIAEDIDFKVGDKVKVGFDGTIRESFPLQINTTSIQLK